MPEPLKNLYNEKLIDGLSQAIVSLYPEFNHQNFKQDIFDQSWSERELKDRMAHISKTLKDYLPQDYAQSLNILKQASSRFNGFEYMFFPGFVEMFGIEQFDLSIDALEAVTPYSSSEFAIRPFIIQYGEKTMNVMNDWAKSENEHVRRLASEGCRPRLPWAMALPAFKKDPSAILPILEQLKQDPSEYVRRSVANNLNDIGKDNPEVLIDIATKWIGQHKDTDWIVKHACRSLLKAGEPRVLTLFGFADAEHVDLSNFTCDESVSIGDALSFSFELHTHYDVLGKLRLEYAIDFMKKNGKPARKVFKIAEADYGEKRKTVNKAHSFKLISTRTYYPGAHGLAIIINGKEVASQAFKLDG